MHDYKDRSTDAPHVDTPLEMLAYVMCLAAFGVLCAALVIGWLS
jgi:hypothetical protein